MAIFRGFSTGDLNGVQLPGSQVFWWGVRLENKTLWSVKNPVSFGDNLSVTLTRFGTLVIKRLSILLPRVGFFIELCMSRDDREGLVK